MARRVVVSAPATIANLGPGFDVFGLALSEPADVIEARLEGSEIVISSVSGVGSDRIPKDSSENAATIAAGKVAELVGSELGAEFVIKKGIRPRGGLGSSGASSAAGALAASELLGGKLDEGKLIEAAAYGEGQVSGGEHYDNVTASIAGGFVIVASTNPLEYFKLEPPAMKIVIAQPEIELATKNGRSILPKEVNLKDAVANVGRASTMTAALKGADIKLFGKHMIDSIAEPVRAHMVKGFVEARQAALDAGALGAAMAGAGPSVFAVMGPSENPEGVAKAMKESFESAGSKCETIITSPGEGAKVLSKEE